MVTAEHESLTRGITTLFVLDLKIRVDSIYSNKKGDEGGFTFGYY